MTKQKILLLIVLTFLLSLFSYGQENLGTYQIRVSLNKDNWVYELNQPVKYEVSVTLNNKQVAGLPIKYACGLEQMPPTIEKTFTTTNQSLMIDAGTLKEPGFLRCIVTMEKDGRTYRGLATAGFRPDLIKPTVSEPKDFDKFWNDGKTALAKLPIDAKMELMPNLGTSKVDVYHVSLSDYATNHFPLNKSIPTFQLSRMAG